MQRCCLREEFDWRKLVLRVLEELSLEGRQTSQTPEMTLMLALVASYDEFRSRFACLFAIGPGSSGVPIPETLKGKSNLRAWWSHVGGAPV